MIQRPWGEHEYSNSPNETIHLDYLQMSSSTDGLSYVLVIKDELTHYIELIACVSSSSAVAVRGIVNWSMRFGNPKTLVTDQGSHFTSQLLGKLRELLGFEHRVTPVNSLWLNGTVERVNRDILQVSRALLLERRLSPSS